MRWNVSRLTLSIATVLSVLLGVSVLRFGRPFLGQFFINPFQMFVVIPWGVALYCLNRGFVPLKHGGRIDRDEDPRNFWFHVRAYAAVGVLFFLIDLALAWMVLSRRY